jgi:hypothetical protein
MKNITCHVVYTILFPRCYQQENIMLVNLTNAVIIMPDITLQGNKYRQKTTTDQELPSDKYLKKLV